MNELKSIAVFTGSATGHSQAICDASIALAKSIAQRKATLIYGGANIGLMGIMADAALKKGAKVIGVLPHSLQQWEIAHPKLTQLIFVESMAERKTVIMERADSFITLPGGIGTLDELFEVYTLARLEYHHKPIGILNTNGYYNQLIAFLDTMTEHGFLDKKTRTSLCISESIDDLLTKMENAKSLKSFSKARFEQLKARQTDKAS